jgi:hypothetical protein
MAIMAAQGRSLGFSHVFTTQDIPAMLRETQQFVDSIDEVWATATSLAISDDRD